jgi:ABC-2 type transport system permease protein
MITENSLDLSRWAEKPKGVGYRRWVIVSTGLRLILRSVFFRILLFLAWTAGALMAAAGFLFSQTVASGGWLETLSAHLGPRFEALSSALGGMVVLYPDICIRGLFTLIFWLQSFFGLGLSLIALTLVVPRLVTRDRASNALTIYLARPLTSMDYLLGKLGLIAGLLLLLWTGPLILGWVLSMLVAPDRDFFVYSVSPLLRALLFNGIGLVALSAISLGVSALSRTSRNTVILWISLWLIAGVLAKTPAAPDWLRHASFSYDLRQVRGTVFRLDRALTDAGSMLPLLNRQFAQNLSEAGAKAETTDFGGALGGLCVLVVLSSGVFLRKLRPE